MLATAVFGNGALVCGGVGREAMPAGAVGPRDEKQVVGGGRMESGGESGGSGVRDGSGGEADGFVGIVGVVAIEVGSIDCAAPVAEEESGINGSGVGIELHTDGEALGVDSGDEGAFGGDGRFLLDEGGEDDGGENGLRGFKRGPFAAELGDHESAEGLGGGYTGEAVGGGEEEALERGGGGGEVLDQLGILSRFEESGLCDEALFANGLGDVEEVVAFGDAEFVEVDIAAGQAVENLPWGGWFRELVLAGLELTVGLEEAHQGELPSVAEDAVAG